MTYASEVYSDGPTHWWRCGDLPGAAVVADAGPTPAFLWPTPAVLPTFGYTGVAEDGGSLVAFPNLTLAPQMVPIVDMAPVPYTLEEWLYLSEVPATIEFTAQTDGTQGYGHGFLGLGGTSQLRVFESHTGGTTEKLSGATPPLGQWQHLVSTHDGATLIGYLNGASFGGVACIGHTAPTSRLFVAGHRGLYTEIAIYPTALSAARIAAHYAAASRDTPSPYSAAAFSNAVVNDLGAILAAVRKSF